MNPIIDAISPLLDKILSFIPNPVDREKARLEHAAAILAALQQNDQSQLEVNKVEAASSSIFVAGWRPACGWVCVFGLAWTFVLQPFLDWGLNLYHPGISTPVLDSSQLMSLLFGMLGMGALRSFDKVKGTDSK